jgi:hypothetical protein
MALNELTSATATSRSNGTFAHSGCIVFAKEEIKQE